MILGIAGQKGVGKDTLAEIFQNIHGYKHKKFAGTLKKMLGVLLLDAGLEPPVINAMINGNLREVSSPIFCGKSTRYAMQTLGTEWRDMLGQQLWTNILKAQLLTAKEPHNYIISDVRFHHEVKMIHELGGKVILLTRGPFTDDPHPSEAEIPFLKHDFYFSNTGPLEDLVTFSRHVLGAI